MKISNKYILLLLVPVLTWVACNDDNTVEPNMEPVGDEPNTFTVSEFISDTEPIGQLEATDEDPGATLTFSIVTNDRDLFEVTSGGELSLASGASLDYETATVHEILVRASDGELDGVYVVTINVKDDLSDNIMANILPSFKDTTELELVGTVQIIFELDRQVDKEGATIGIEVIASSSTYSVDYEIEGYTENDVLDGFIELPVAFGDSTATLTVSVTDDDELEPNETIEFKITYGADSTIVPASDEETFRLTMLDNDLVGNLHHVVGMNNDDGVFELWVQDTLLLEESYVGGIAGITSPGKMEYDTLSDLLYIEGENPNDEEDSWLYEIDFKALGFEDGGQATITIDQEPVLKESEDFPVQDSLDVYGYSSSKGIHMDQESQVLYLLINLETYDENGWVLDSYPLLLVYEVATGELTHSLLSPPDDLSGDSGLGLIGEEVYAISSYTGFWDELDLGNMAYADEGLTLSYTPEVAAIALYTTPDRFNGIGGFSNGAFCMTRTDFTYHLVLVDATGMVKLALPDPLSDFPSGITSIPADMLP